MSGGAVLVVRPHRLRQVCVVLAVVVVVGFTAVALALGAAPPGELTFRPPDQAALIVLSLLIAAGLMVLTAARVEADADGIRVRNALKVTVLPWAVVQAVRFDDGSPWASLDLHDDDTVALFAVQANDKERAVEAVRALRALLDASRTPPPSP